MHCCFVVVIIVVLFCCGLELQGKGNICQSWVSIKCRRVLTSDELQGDKIVYMFFLKVTISHLIFKMDDKWTNMHEVQL